MKFTLAFALLMMVAAGEGVAFAEGPAKIDLVAPRKDPPPVVWHLGHGEPKSTIIFMHGLGGDPEELKEVVTAMLTPQGPNAGAVKVIALWMRPQRGPHTMTDQLERARKVIDATPGPVFLMGHSFGGKAALMLAKEYPHEKVRGLIGMAPSVNMLQSFWKKVTGERELPPQEVTEPALAAHEAYLVDKLTHLPPDADHKEVKSMRSLLRHVRLMKDLARHDEPGVEGDVKRPTLVFHGTEDEAVSIHYARRFAAANPQRVKMVELPGVNHAFKTNPEVVHDMGRHVQAFVQQHRR
jgi:pimeloyl-ACP methyl ester carboxylesterase